VYGSLCHICNKASQIGGADNIMYANVLTGSSVGLVVTEALYVCLYKLVIMYTITCFSPMTDD